LSQCNVAIKKDDKFKQCNLDYNHIGNHNFEIVKIKFAGSKQASILIITQCFLWSGVAMATLTAKLLWDTMSLMGVFYAIFVFFGFLIGGVIIAQQLEKKWDLERFEENN